MEVFLKHVVAAGTTLAFRTGYRDLYLPFPDLRDCHDAWIAFIRDGDPNTTDSAEWPRFDEKQRAVMEFGDEVAVREDLLPESRRQWEGVR